MADKAVATGIIMDHDVDDDPDQHKFVKYYDPADRPAARAVERYDRVEMVLPRATMELKNPEEIEIVFTPEGRKYPGKIYDIYDLGS